MAKRQREQNNDTVNNSKKLKITTEEQEEIYSTIKLPLASALRTEYRDQFIKIFSERSLLTTEFCFLASLNIIEQLNTAIDNNDLSIFNKSPSDFVRDSFYAVLVGYKCSDRFEGYLTEFEIRKPNNDCFKNSFKYTYGLYETNFRNNIVMHAKSRVKKYFKTIDNIEPRDIEATVTFLFRRNANNLNKNDRLLDELNNIGFAHREQNSFAEMIEENWFQSVPIFMKMQRAIYNYNQQQRMQMQIGNFTVIPVCGHQRQHVRHDLDAMFGLLRNTKILRMKRSIHRLN